MIVVSRVAPPPVDRPPDTISITGISLDAAERLMTFLGVVESHSGDEVSQMYQALQKHLHKASFAPSVYELKDYCGNVVHGLKCVRR